MQGARGRGRARGRARATPIPGEEGADVGRPGSSAPSESQVIVSGITNSCSLTRFRISSNSDVQKWMGGVL